MDYNGKENGCPTEFIDKEGDPKASAEARLPEAKDELSKPIISSLSEEQKQYFAEELKCPICTETLFKPYTLLCGHSFCRYCLIFSVNVTNPEGTARHSSRAQCPTCRAPFKVTGGSFHINITLWNMIKRIYGEEILIQEADRTKMFEAERLTLSSREGGAGGIVTAAASVSNEATPLTRFVENEAVHPDRVLTRLVRTDFIDGMEHHQWSFAFSSFPQRFRTGGDLTFGVAVISMEEDEVMDGGRPILLSSDDMELVDDTYDEYLLRACLVNNSDGDSDHRVHLATTEVRAMRGRATFNFTDVPAVDENGDTITRFGVYVYQARDDSIHSANSFHVCDVDSSELFLKLQVVTYFGDSSEDEDDGSLVDSHSDDNEEEEEEDEDLDGFICDDVEYETGAEDVSELSDDSVVDASDVSDREDAPGKRKTAASSSGPSKRPRVVILDDDDDDDY
jgi:hypothetical protein